MERTFLLNELEIILSEHILTLDMAALENINNPPDLINESFACKCRKTCSRQRCSEKESRKPGQSASNL